MDPNGRQQSRMLLQNRVTSGQTLSRGEQGGTQGILLLAATDRLQGQCSAVPPVHTVLTVDTGVQHILQQIVVIRRTGKGPAQIFVVKSKMILANGQKLVKENSAMNPVQKRINLFFPDLTIIMLGESDDIAQGPGTETSGNEVLQGMGQQKNKVSSAEPAAVKISRALPH